MGKLAQKMQAEGKENQRPESMVTAVETSKPIQASKKPLKLSNLPLTYSIEKEAIVFNRQVTPIATAMEQ